MTHSSARQVGKLIQVHDMTHSYERHDAFICLTRLIYIRDVTHLCARQVGKLMLGHTRQSLSPQYHAASTKSGYICIFSRFSCGIRMVVSFLVCVSLFLSRWLSLEPSPSLSLSVWMRERKTIVYVCVSLKSYTLTDHVKTIHRQNTLRN